MMVSKTSPLAAALCFHCSGLDYPQERCNPYLLNAK
jgi:hypothetical protein